MKYTLIPRSHEAWKKKPSCGCLSRSEERKNSRNKKIQNTKKKKERTKEKKKTNSYEESRTPLPPKKKLGKTHKLMGKFLNLEMSLSQLLLWPKVPLYATRKMLKLSIEEASVLV
jgi:hypothetical protein